MAPTGKRVLEVIKLPRIGSIWRHIESGRPCTILYHANYYGHQAKTPRNWPLSIVFMHQGGNVWTRPVKIFNEKYKPMTLHDRPAKPN